jgi:hypothetical protein
MDTRRWGRTTDARSAIGLVMLLLGLVWTPIALTLLVGAARFTARSERVEARVTDVERETVVAHVDKTGQAQTVEVKHAHVSFETKDGRQIDMILDGASQTSGPLYVRYLPDNPHRAEIDDPAAPAAFSSPPSVSSFGGDFLMDSNHSRRLIGH